MSRVDVVIGAVTALGISAMWAAAFWSVRVAQAMAVRPVHVWCDCDDGSDDYEDDDGDDDPADVDRDGVDRLWARPQQAVSGGD